MTLPPGFKVTELKNAAVDDLFCEVGSASWIAGYKSGQDFHVEIDVPDTSPGIVYGLNQTMLLSIRSSIYRNPHDRCENQEDDIQLCRAPASTDYDFKKGWFDSESADPAPPNSPYYSSEAIAKTELRKEKIDGKDCYYITLRMRKTPRVELPSQIQLKSDKSVKRTIKQLDVEELYLITLFRDEDEENGKKTPLIQWIWKHKLAWGCFPDGNPKYEPGPSHKEKCTQSFPLKDKYKLEGPTETAAEHYDQFLVLDNLGHCFLDAESQHKVTEEWEACSM